MKKTKIILFALIALAMSLLLTSCALFGGEGNVEPHEHHLVDDAAIEASCSQYGRTAGKHCTLCDYKEGGETVPLIPHSYVVDVAGKEPTCTESGLSDAVHCTVCNHKEDQKTVAALGHSLVDVKAFAPTCTLGGREVGKKCTACEYVELGEVIPALGHQLVTDTEAIAATCSQPGMTAGMHCSLCDYKVDAVATPKLLHDYVVIEVLEAHCDSYSIVKEHCNICGNEETIAARIGHKFENGTCVYCGDPEQ